MSCIQKTVYYCCVSKGSRILYTYSGGDHELENLAALCLERTPPFHAWYFETVRERTYGFLMEDGFVYFAIVDEGLGNPGILKFLEHVKDEFNKVSKNGSKGGLLGLNSLCLQEQLVPVIRCLISSLEHVSQSNNCWMVDVPTSQCLDLPPSSGSNANDQIEVATSTKVPLLGKSSKQEKKMKNHEVEIRDNESKSNRHSMDQRSKIGSASNNQDTVVSPILLQKGSSSMRIRAGTHDIRKTWWRLVRIVIAIDAVLCALLLGIWLLICNGLECVS